MKKENERERIFRNYLGWKIYFRKRGYSLADRDKLVKDFKRRFQGWYSEEKDSELVFTDPEYETPVIIRFGNFVTPSQQNYSVEIESRLFGWKRVHMRNHQMVLSRVLKMLPRGKKEAYRIEKQGLVKLSTKGMKHFEDVLTGYRGHF